MRRAGLIIAGLGALELVTLALWCAWRVWRGEGLPPATLEAELFCGLVMAAGFALAALSILQTGFGALDRFFQAALERSAPRPAKDESPAARKPHAPDGPAPGRVVRRGAIGSRPYAEFSDGAVEVQTLLGPRRFGSLPEAIEFIGA